MKHIQKFAGNLQNLVISRVVLVKHSALLPSPDFFKNKVGVLFFFFLAPVGALNLRGSFDSFPNSALCKVNLTLNKHNKGWYLQLVKHRISIN